VLRSLEANLRHCKAGIFSTKTQSMNSSSDRNTTPAGFCPKHCGTGLTQDCVYTQFIPACTTKDQCLTLLAASSVRMNKTSRTPACYTQWTPGVTLNGNSINTRVYHRILLPISLVFCRLTLHEAPFQVRSSRRPRAGSELHLPEILLMLGP
jgi:hypothetical protein